MVNANSPKVMDDDEEPAELNFELNIVVSRVRIRIKAAIPCVGEHSAYLLVEIRETGNE